MEREPSHILTAAALWATTNVIAIVLVLRSWAGAFQGPAPALAYVIALPAVTGAGVFAFVCALRSGGQWRWGKYPDIPGEKIGAAALSAFPTLAIACVLFPDASLVGGLFVVLCCGAGLVAIGFLAKTAPLLATPENPAEPAARDFDPDCSLWMSRVRRPNGEDYLEGVAAAEFASRQKQTSVHLAFCPPFASTPEVACTADEAGSVRLKIGAVYPYGARIDLKRTAEPLDEAVLRVHFSATGPQMPPAPPPPNAVEPS
jgi:hypothetical protein